MSQTEPYWSVLLSGNSANPSTIEGFTHHAVNTHTCTHSVWLTLSVFIQRSNLGRVEGLSLLIGWSRFGPTVACGSRVRLSISGSQLITTRPSHLSANQLLINTVCDIIWPSYCAGDQEDPVSNHSTYLFISSSFSLCLMRNVQCRGGGGGGV